jgi:hypothetical protein
LKSSFVIQQQAATSESEVGQSWKIKNVFGRVGKLRMYLIRYALCLFDDSELGGVEPGVEFSMEHRPEKDSLAMFFSQLDRCWCRWLYLRLLLVLV